MKRFKASISAAGMSFDFEICCRRIELGVVGKVWYYWMDTRQLRGGDCGNYRACVDYWWACMQADGLTSYQPTQDAQTQEQVAANQELLALAELYPHVCKSRGQQDVFTDAVPRPTKLGRSPAHSAPNSAVATAADDLPVLDSSTAANLLNIAKSRNIAAIRDEIRDALVGTLPSGAVERACSKAFGCWMDGAVQALQARGRGALKSFLADEIARLYNRYRRLGKVPNLKLFTNLVAYEAKVAFYTCYANAWVGLRDWLRRNHVRNFDAASEHLLRLMHAQNRRDKPGDDVFWGQVLSLHPLSSILMQQPHHRVALGNYLASLSRFPRRANVNIGRIPAYWELVGSIMAACREYLMHREAGESRRHSQGPGAHCRELVSTEDDAPPPARIVFEDYARATELTCEACGSRDLKYVTQKVLSFEKQELRVEFTCEACGGRCETTVSAEDLLAK